MVMRKRKDEASVLTPRAPRSFGIVMWEIMPGLPPMIHLPQREMEREMKKRDEELMKVIGNVFGVSGVRSKGSKSKRGRRRVSKGGIPDGMKDRTRSDSEDGGRRRRVRTEALEDVDDPHNRFMRESLLGGQNSSSHHMDLSLSGGIAWGGQDDIRVGRGNVTAEDVVIR